MKWDEESDPEDIDDDDRAAFEGLRKVFLYPEQCRSHSSNSTIRIYEHSWILY
jgi:hypothetical protein